MGQCWDISKGSELWFHTFSEGLLSRKLFRVSIAYSQSGGPPPLSILISDEPSLSFSSRADGQDESIRTNTKSKPLEDVHGFRSSSKQPGSVQYTKNTGMLKMGRSGKILVIEDFLRSWIAEQTSIVEITGIFDEIGLLQKY